MRLGVISEKENEHARIFVVSKMHLQPFSRHGTGHNSHEFFADGSTRLLSEGAKLLRRGGGVHTYFLYTPPLPLFQNPVQAPRIVEPERVNKFQN